MHPGFICNPGGVPASSARRTTNLPYNGYFRCLFESLSWTCLRRRPTGPPTAITITHQQLLSNRNLNARIFTNASISVSWRDCKRNVSTIENRITKIYAHPSIGSCRPISPRKRSAWTGMVCVTHAQEYPGLRMVQTYALTIRFDPQKPPTSIPQAPLMLLLFPTAATTRGGHRISYEPPLNVCGPRYLD